MAAENVTINITQEEYRAEALSRNDNIAQLPEEGETRQCPLCQSPIRLFFINFNEKFLMCENVTCDFPFGYEELQIVQTGEGVVVDDEGISLRTRTFDFLTSGGSETSEKTSEGGRSNRVLDDDSQFNKTYNFKPVKRKKKEEEDEQMKKNIEDIREMNEELSSLNNDLSESNQATHSCLRNEKWIQNLNSLQKMSGVQLLKPEEMGLLRKTKEPLLGLGELKIDIAPGNVTNVPSIRIEIHNTNSENDITLTKDKPTGKKPLPV